MSTEFPTKNGINRQWHLIDAQDVVLGKLASKAAMVLMGKTKPSYTPFIDAGDHVIVINAAKVKVTGRKEEDKLYRHFTGYPGGLVEKSLKRVRAEKPTRICGGCHRRYAPQEQARQTDVPETECLRG